MSPVVYTVSEVVRQINRALESLGNLVVEGEISQFTCYQSSGHWYFSVKDDKSVLPCVMWRSYTYKYRMPKIGDKVRLKGTLDVFASSGKMQFKATEMQRAGEGELYEKFLRMQRELAALGWFDTARKRPIPAVPRRIGIITSSHGAALKDALHRLKARAPYVAVTVYDTPVQGQDNAINIARAIRKANRLGGDDVLLLIRGGGSISDLWNFNEKIVAEAVLKSRIPIITGIGHETDTTIADLVADLRAPTPTGAAEAAAEKADVLLHRVSQVWARIAQQMFTEVNRQAMGVDYFSERFLQVPLVLQRYRKELSANARLVSLDWSGHRNFVLKAYRLVQNEWRVRQNEDEGRLDRCRDRFAMPMREYLNTARLELQNVDRRLEDFKSALRQREAEIDLRSLNFSWPIREKARACETLCLGIGAELHRKTEGLTSEMQRQFTWLKRNLPDLSAQNVARAALTFRSGIRHTLSVERIRLEGAEKIFSTLSQALTREQVCVFKAGRVVTSVADIQNGDDIEVIMSDGRFVARVGKVFKMPVK